MTSQIQEKIIINEEEHVLLSKPFEPYLKNLSIKSKLIGPGSDCWRGYVGTWQIKNNVLFLVKMKYWCYNDDVDLVKLLMPKVGHLIAEWYTGELRIPLGKPIHYNGYFYPMCEKEMVFQVEQGIIQDHQIIEYVAPEIDPDEEQLPF